MEDNNNIEENLTTVETKEEEIVPTSIEPVEEPKKKKKKKKKIGRIISDIIIFLLFIVIVFEIVIGMVNMQRISDEKEPVWYLSTKTVETDLKNETIYNLGLYKIVKTDTSKKTTVSLKPFFIAD